MMVVFRLLWALFLACLVAFAFHRSWRWEHGASMPTPLFGDKSRRLSKDTVVWVTPLIFPILIILTFVLLLLLDEDINHFFLFVLDVLSDFCAAPLPRPPSPWGGRSEAV